MAKSGSISRPLAMMWLWLRLGLGLWLRLLLLLLMLGLRLRLGCRLRQHVLASSIRWGGRGELGRRRLSFPSRQGCSSGRGLWRSRPAPGLLPWACLRRRAT